MAYNDPATHLSGLGQTWRPNAFNCLFRGAAEQHCPEQVSRLLMTRYGGTLRLPVTSIVP